MEKNNIDKAKDLLIYAPLGAFGFVKDNAPTFYNMFVNRGKRDVSKTNFVPTENLTTEAQQRGEEVAQNVVVGAMKVIDFVENSVRNLADQIDVKENEVADNILHTIKENEVNDAFEDKVITQEDVNTAFSPLVINEIINDYEKLSAPEIIAFLDDIKLEELITILEFEKDYRNRSTIIHAINYQIDNTERR
jgi:hypothetical protein